MFIGKNKVTLGTTSLEVGAAVTAGTVNSTENGIMNVYGTKASAW